MIRSLRLVVAGLILSTATLMSPAQAQQVTSEPKTGVVEQSVRDFFDNVAARFDYARLDEVVTEDVRFIEAGRIMDRAAFKGFMQQFEGKMTISYELSDFRTRVVDDVAYSSWRNRGRIVEARATRDVEWLESAVLVFREGKWLIDQFQSASVRRPNSNGARPVPSTSGHLGGGAGKGLAHWRDALGGDVHGSTNSPTLFSTARHE